MYYRLLPDGIAFSSDFTLLLNFGRNTLDYHSIYALLKYASTPPPSTLIKEIQCLVPSQYGRFHLSTGKLSLNQYYKYSFPANTQDSDYTLLTNTFSSIGKIISSENFTFLLSGGIDSTLLAYFAGKHNRVRGAFLSFGEKDPETQYAMESAKRANCELTVVTMPTSGKIIKGIIEEIAKAYPYPFNDYSIIPNYYLIKEAETSNRTIFIDGTGGDACFDSPILGMHPIWMHS